MSSNMEKVSSNKVKLRLELSAPAFDEGMQKAYLKMRGRINVPGFRRGKAPRKLIERMYGESVFYEDAFDLVFPDLFEAAVKEHSLTVVSRPDVEIEKIGGGEPLVVMAEVYVKPDVELGQYKGLAVARGDDSIDEEAVDQEIGRVRERNARETEIEDRPVQDDDIVSLSYAGTVDGVAFEGGTAEDATLEIGSGQFIPGFEEQMVGMTIGEERDLNIKFPDEYHAEELKGKDAVFHVKVKGIHVRELPELDDEFAKDVSEFDTLEEYKQDIRAKLESEAKKRVDAEFENALVEAAVKGATIDVPDAMIDTQVDQMIRDMAMQMAYQGISMEDFMKYTGQTMESLREQRRESAEQRVRGELILEAIRKAESIEPSEADIDDVMQRYATGEGKSVEDFKAGLTDAQIEYIKEDAATIATLELLKREAKQEDAASAEKE